MGWRMLSSAAGLHLPEASSTTTTPYPTTSPSASTTENVLRHSQVPLGGKNTPGWDPLCSTNYLLFAWMECLKTVWPCKWKLIKWVAVFYLLQKWSGFKSLEVGSQKLHQPEYPLKQQTGFPRGLHVDKLNWQQLDRWNSHGYVFLDLNSIREIDLVARTDAHRYAFLLPPW